MLIFLILFVAVLIILATKDEQHNNTSDSYGMPEIDKGSYGEFLVERKLSPFIRAGARIFKNVYIPKENNETTELDLIMLTKSCIIVFESKNRSGWIFGSQDQPKWTETFPAGRGESNKFSFQNPIIQNRGHINALKRFLRKNIPIVSVVVFSDECTFKEVPSNMEDVFVIQNFNTINVVSLLLQKYNNEVLTDDEFNRMCSLLNSCSHVSTAVKEKHIQDIKARHMPKHPNKVSATTPAHTGRIIPVRTECTTDIHAAETAPAQAEEFAEENAEKTVEVEQIGVEPVKEEGTEKAASPAEENPPKRISCVVNICPRCGGVLVLKVATRGARKGNKFLGCSNYPNCNYIKNL